MNIKSEVSPNGTNFDEECSDHSSDSEPLISRFSKRSKKMKSRPKSIVKKLSSVRKRKSREENGTLKKEQIPIPDVFVKGNFKKAQGGNSQNFLRKFVRFF